MSYLDNTGLAYLWGKISAALSGKAAASHTHAYVPTARKVNGKALSADVTLSASDVGAAAASHTHAYAGSASAGGAATTALACTGNAATATKATKDSAGQQISTTYIKALTASGRTVTYTRGDGSTGTITTQDSNTTYAVATTSAAGLMSAADKVKLNGVAEGANARWSTLTLTIPAQAPGALCMVFEPISGLTADSAVIVAPAPDSRETWQSCGIFGSHSGTSLSFGWDTPPTAAVTVNVLIIN